MLHLPTEPYSEEMRAFWAAPARASFDRGGIPAGVTREWIELRSGLPWLELDINYPAAEMLEEAHRLRHEFVKHRPAHHPGWKSLCIRGISPYHTLAPKRYGYGSEDDVPYIWTEVAARCPVTTEFFRDAYPFRKKYRIRFMLLEPGGYIAPHNDTRTNYLSAVNFALNNPEGCYFKMADWGCVPFNSGKAFQLDIGNVHSCINLSDEPRLHIIAHCIHHKRAWGEIIDRSFRKNVRDG